MKKIKAKVLCLLITTALFAGIAFMTPSTYGIAVVRVDPPNISATLYDVVSISVVIDSVENLYGYEFKLFWNTSILQCTQWNYTSNTWIENPSTPPWSTYFEAANYITLMPDGRSRYWVSLTAIPPEAPVSGSFTVATLKFNVTGIGETLLDLSSTVLGDYPEGNPIPHNVVDGRLGTVFHDVAVVRIQPQSFSILQNSSVEIEVEVINLGNVPENFNVTAYYNSTTTGIVNAIGKQDVVNLDVNANETLTFVWTTTGVEGGFYQIFANASFVEQEIDTSNNQLVDGIIEIASEIRRDLAIYSVRANATIFAIKETANVEVAVRNQGIVDETDVDLTVHFNFTLLGKVSIPVIRPGSTQKYSFIWGTVGELGNYVLRANVTLFMDETNTTNNEKTLAVIVTETPIAEFTISPAEPTVNQEVTFNASASYDPDGSIVDYSWNFGDGFYPGNGVVVTHRYTEVGTFNVTLTVKDDKGLTYSVNRALTYSSRKESTVSVKAAVSGGIPQEVFAAISILSMVGFSVVYIRVLRRKVIPKPRRT